MLQFKNYNYNEKKVTALVTDTSGGNFLWIAFAQNSEGNCILRKVNASKPDQTYFNVELAVDNINRLKILGNFIYLAVDHSTIMGYKISLTNPLNLQYPVDIPSGVNEKPVDIGVGASNLYYLFPGELSGEIAKIVKINTTPTVVETIDLQKTGEIITYARGITVDSNEDIWVCTYTDPANLVRVYQTSGGIYVFDTTPIV